MAHHQNSNSDVSSKYTSSEVSISSEDVGDKAKKYVIYRVVINVSNRCWFVLRRYNEFHRLYEILKKQYPDCGLKLPGKRLFGNLDPQFLESRRDGLHNFVQLILDSPEMCTHAEVRLFLMLDNPKGVETPDDADHMDAEVAMDEDQVVNLGVSDNPKAKATDFNFLKVIGKGSFGKVLLAKHKIEGMVYAVKVLQKKAIMKRNEVKHIMAERNVLLKNIRHPFLVGLHYSFQTKEKLYFVLDYVNGGELFYHLQKERYFTESRAKFYSAEIASAIGYLHNHDIIYRDLKPENILLDSMGHIVLTDFGLCKEGIEATDTTTTFCGTPEYLAPEVIKKQAYDRSVDWWCLGAVLYEMVYGLPPFYSRDTAEMYDNILYKPLRLRTNISVAARNILESLLQKDREKRLGAGEKDFLEIKTHDFFSSVNWDDLINKRIKPPYNPNVSGQLDLRHFDPEFTREPVPPSVGKSADSAMISVSVQEADNAFIGFTYVTPTELNAD